MLHDILELIDQYFVDYIEGHVIDKTKRPSLDYYGLTKELKKRESFFYLTVNAGTAFDLDQFIKDYIDFYLVLTHEIVFNINDLCCCFDKIIKNIQETSEKIKDPALAFLNNQTKENFNGGYLF